MGKFDARSQPGYIRFGNRIKLEIASPVDKICESFASGLMKKRLLLGKNLVDVGSIAIDRQEVTSDTITVKTLSPVVTYSTLMKPDGKKYTCYFQPGEPDFQRICTENLRKSIQPILMKKHLQSRGFNNTSFPAKITYHQVQGYDY